MSAAFMSMQKYLAQANSERGNEAPKVVVKRRREAPLVTVTGMKRISTTPKCVKKSTGWSSEDLQKMANNMVSQMRAPECKVMQNLNREVKLIEF
jgi:hypothetical protein